jgi:hypothetical protein
MAKTKDRSARKSCDTAKQLSAPFERRDIIDECKKHFIFHSNAPRGSSVVLYGGVGLGKRTAAAQVAKEITAKDGRRILTINGMSIVTFICDYISIHEKLTGQTLPRGLGLRLSIPKIRHLLESRQDEWFLVITDLSFYLEQDPHLCSAIPTKGHVLITSKDLHFPGENDHKQVKIGPTTIAVASIAIARQSIQVYAKGLFDREVYQLARQLSPKLLNISWYEYGKLQRWARAAPLFLRVTMINLQLLRLDFAAYRDHYERSFDHSRLSQYQGIGWYATAFNVACTILWKALGDHDTWAQKLLHLLAMVYSDSIPLRLVENLPVFRDTLSDQLSPALDLLASHGIVLIGEVNGEQTISVIHRDLARWVYKHGLHQAKSSEDQHRRLVESWAVVFHEELAGSGVNAECYPPYQDSERLWSLYTLINMFVTTQFHLPRSNPPASEPILYFLVNVMESTIHWWPVTIPPGYLLDETVPVLLALQLTIPLNTFNAYYLRIRLCRMETYYLVSEYPQAEQYLRQAKRSLTALEMYEEQNEVIVDTNLHAIHGYEINPTASSSTAFQQQNRNSLPITPAKSAPATPVPILTLYQRRYEDLEIALLVAQRRYSSVEILLRPLLNPPSQTSFSDPYILARRYSWMAQANSADMATTLLDVDMYAVRYSHQAMVIWASLPEDERWATKGGSDFKVLNWVNTHVEQLVASRKFKGALIFLPRLLERFSETIPSKMDIRIFQPAKRLVECYVKLDRIKEADEVVEKILETFVDNPLSMKALSGNRDNRTDVSNSTDMKLAWDVLFELARGHQEFGNYAVAEGLIRYIIGSWRRRKVGSYEEVFWIADPKLSQEENEKERNEVEANNKASREARDEREATWKASCPIEWWCHLIELLAFQGRDVEAGRLVLMLRQEFAQDKIKKKLLRKSLTRSKDSIRKMEEIYQRACEIEKMGWTKEWQALLSRSKTSFFLRKAVKAFGNPVKRVKRGREFETDLSVGHGSSDARECRILYMLDRIWSHSGYSSRLKTRTEGYIQDIDTYPVKKQRHLCELWRWCECRKRRSRAFSLPWYECEDKWWTLEIARREDLVKSRKKWKQTTLDNWTYLLVDKPAPRPKRCKDDCPCINANIAGLAAQAAIEKRLWLYTEPLKPGQINRKRNTSPYRIPGKILKPHEFSKHDLNPIRCGTDFDNDYDTLKWLQAEFDVVERDDENYIIPNAVNIPTITISSPKKKDTDAEGDKSLKADEDWFTFNWNRDLERQENIMNYVKMSDEARKKHESERNEMWGLTEDGYPIELRAEPDGSNVPGELERDDESDCDAEEEKKRSKDYKSGGEVAASAVEEGTLLPPEPDHAPTPQPNEEAVLAPDTELKLQRSFEEAGIAVDLTHVDVEEQEQPEETFEIEMSGAVGVEPEEEIEQTPPTVDVCQ